MGSAWGTVTGLAPNTWYVETQNVFDSVGKQTNASGSGTWNKTATSGTDMKVATAYVVTRSGGPSVTCVKNGVAVNVPRGSKVISGTTLTYSVAGTAGNYYQLMVNGNAVGTQIEGNGSTCLLYTSMESRRLELSLVEEPSQPRLTHTPASASF